MSRKIFHISFVPPRMWRLLIALLAFTASIALFVNNVFVAPDRATAGQMVSLAEQIRRSDAELTIWMREINNPVSAPIGAAAPRQDDLLNKLNSIALQTSVHVIRLSPLADKRAPIKIEVEAPFANVVLFIGQLEARGGTPHRLQMQARASDAGEIVLVSVTFLLDWLPNEVDRQLSGSAARLLASNSVSADPFRRLTNLSETYAPAVHELTGITKGDDGSFATIDGRDYRVGDLVGAGKITVIWDDSVQLSSGNSQLWLHFHSRQR